MFHTPVKSDGQNYSQMNNECQLMSTNSLACSSHSQSVVVPNTEAILRIVKMPGSNWAFLILLIVDCETSALEASSDHAQARISNCH